MGRLENTEFIVQLGKLFDRTKSKGSVFITSKKAVEFVKKADRPEVGAPKVKPAAPGAVLVRAVAGSVKLSTVVPQADVFKFHVAYMGVVKQHMTTLKKKERKPRSEQKKNKKAAAAAAGSSSGSTDNLKSPKSPTVAK